MTAIEGTMQVREPSLADTAVASTSRRASPPLFTLLVALAVLPAAVTMLRLVGAHWHPPSDYSLEMLKIRDVFGRHTPLTGVQSRFGWDHPGPLMFWVLAPFYRAFGNTGVLFGTGIVNGLAVVASVALARRRGGVMLAALVTLVLLVLCWALGPNLLVDPWNPWIAVLPFFTFVLVAWSVAERDLAMLPWAVAVGSFVVQTHVGYAPLVLGAGAVAAVLALTPKGHAERAHADVVKWLIVAAAVAVALWLAPLFQQLFGHPRNLSAIVHYFRHPTEKAVGLRFGFGLMGTELRPIGPWITAKDTGPFGFATDSSTSSALLLLAAVLGAGAYAWARGNARAGRFALSMFGLAWIGVVAGGRVTGVPWNYLVRWWWVVAALLWCSLAWSLVWAAKRLDVERVAVAAVVAMSIVMAGIVVSNAARARVPAKPFSDAIGRLLPQTTAHLQRSRAYVVRSIDTDIGAVGNGVYFELAARGFRVEVPADLGHAFGSWRVAKDPTLEEITVVNTDDFFYRPAPGATRIAEYDPLTPSQRGRVQVLERSILRSLTGSQSFQPTDVDSPWTRRGLVASGADARELDELAALRRRGGVRRYDVFLVPHA